MIRYIHFPVGHRFYDESEPRVSGQGNEWVCRYYDHHSVGHEAWFTSQERARDYAFMWRTVRGVFTPEIYGGCVSEVSDYWRVPVFVLTSVD